MSGKRHKPDPGSAPIRKSPWIIAAAFIGIAAVAVTAIVLSLQRGGGGIPSTSPIPATQESLAIGAGLYLNNCQVCHGPEGKGGPLAADLTLHIPLFSDGAIFNRISEGFPTTSDPKVMPAFKDQLSKTERWHLVNFLRDKLGDVFEPVLPEEATR